MAAINRFTRWVGALPAIGRGAREALRPAAALTAPNPAGQGERFQNFRARLAAEPAPRAGHIMQLLLARAIVSAKRGNTALLRSLPTLAPTRALAAWASQKCATHDDQFRALIAAADAARDAARWQAGIDSYAAALRLYDHHAGYRVQLGHCHKEAGNGIEAEIAYRDALALGAPAEQVWDHFELVVARNGDSRQTYPPAIVEALAADDGAAVRASLATSHELRLLAWLLLGQEAPEPAWILRMLRTAPERDRLSARLIADPAFLSANRALVALAGRRSSL